jgi:hypothetical protein
MATTTPKRTQPKNEKTRVPGVYRRGDAYVYSYRVAGRSAGDAPAPSTTRGAPSARPRRTPTAASSST